MFFAFVWLGVKVPVTSSVFEGVAGLPFLLAKVGRSEFLVSDILKL